MRSPGRSRLSASVTPRGDCRGSRRSLPPDGLPRQRPEHRQGCRRAGGLQPQLDAFLQEEQTEADERGRGEETPPIQLLVLHLDAARSGAAPGGVDDPVRDLAIAFAIELEVLAAAGI